MHRHTHNQSLQLLLLASGHAKPVKHWGSWELIRRYEPVLANPPEVLLGLYHAQGDDVGTQSPTWTTPISGHGQQFDICFPSY